MSDTVVGRGSWTTADQLLSSATNFALTVVVARYVGANAFGTFAIVYLTYTVCAQTAQAAVGEPLIVRFSGADAGSFTIALREALGAIAMGGVVVGSSLAVVGILLGGPVGMGILILGAATPLLLLQDQVRLASFASGNPRVAFANDALWTALQILGTVAVLATHASAIRFLTVWAASGALAGAAGVAQLKATPHLKRWRNWWDSSSDLALPYILETTALAGGQQLAFYAVGAFAGLSAVGGIRAAVAVFGPLSVLFNIIRVAGIAELSRFHKRGGTKLRAAVTAITAASAGLALAWTVSLLLMPDAIGRNLFGQSWQHARPLLLAVGADEVLLGANYGAFVGLRVLEVAQRTMVIRIACGIVSVGTGVGGAVLGGAQGCCVGLALAAGLSGVALQWEFRRALRSFEASDLPTPTSSDRLSERTVPHDAPATSRADR